MEYATNRTNYSITGMPISSFQNISYELQRGFYEKVIKYSRITPQGEYMNGGKPWEI